MILVGVMSVALLAMVGVFMPVGMASAMQVRAVDTESDIPTLFLARILKYCLEPERNVPEVRV